MWFWNNFVDVSQVSKGKSYKFSFGDYIVKILLGSIDKELDNLDGSVNHNQYKHNGHTTQQNSNNHYKDNKRGGCIIC